MNLRKVLIVTDRALQWDLMALFDQPGQVGRIVSSAFRALWPSVAVKYAITDRNVVLDAGLWDREDVLAFRIAKLETGESVAKLVTTGLLDELLPQVAVLVRRDRFRDQKVRQAICTLCRAQTKLEEGGGLVPMHWSTPS